MMKKRPVRKYYYRGPIERGREWKEGYSRGESPFVEYPWSTRGECRTQAKGDGFRAAFYRDGKLE